MRPFFSPHQYHWFQPLTLTAGSNLILGALLLLAGRRLFWVFVAAAGFLLGTGVAIRLATGTAEWVVLVIALAFGLVGLLLSLFAQKLAVAASGFVMGSFAVERLLLTLQVGWVGWEWAALVAGGILGALLVLALFDWALIVLSSLVGAALIVQVLSPSLFLNLLLYAVLTSVGIAFQSGLLKRAESEKREREGGRRW
jgi:hypothetical protein